MKCMNDEIPLQATAEHDVTVRIAAGGASRLQASYHLSWLMGLPAHKLVDRR
jgi:hypothetical protein